MLKIEIIPALEDNYIYFLMDEKSGLNAVIDPGEADPVTEYMDKHGIEKLDYILNTHHHWDHTNGNKKLKDKFGAKLVAFKGDKERIKDIDIEVTAATGFTLGDNDCDIYEIPGHTTGHIAFHFPASQALFCGDTLFSLGCGRMFEGTPELMWASLRKLRDLPDNTQIYCGHEYTANNGEFCLSIEPDNPFLHRRMEGVRRLREAGRPTVPALLGMEKNTNVFLRADHASLINALPIESKTPEAAFAYLRSQKDNYG